MALRSFGPTRGAGVRIEEQEGDKTITPAALGWCGYAGIFERGPVGKLVVCPTKSDFLKKMGSYVSDSLVPDAALDYYNLANGAGGLLLVRVTDGNETQASYTLYARNPNGLTPMGTLKAANGGRWGGKAKIFAAELDSDSDLSETTLQVGSDNASDFKTDEWKGGYVELSAVPNKRYQIVGNSDDGLIEVAADQTMLTDFGESVDLLYYLVLENEGQALAVKVDDGEENPDSEFSLEIFLNGASVKKWGNLSTDPDDARYWVNVINDDGDNDWVVAEDLWTGAHTPAVRPANYYGKIASVTETVLTSTIHNFVISSPNGGNPTMALGTTTDEMVPQTITITMTSATTGDAVSDKFGDLGEVTLGEEFGPDIKWAPPFTITAGGTALSSDDVLTIEFFPLETGKLVGGLLYPDKVNAKRKFYRIVSNTHKTITVASGIDLTADAESSDEFMVSAPIEMKGGRDGNSEIVDANYEQAWDTESSPFNDVAGMNLGLIKFATPGIASTAVQKAGVAYASAKNHQYRSEIPSNVTTEIGALSYVNDTLGRSDYQKVNFPSYGDVPHPDPASAREGKLKTISLTGMIHGREARIAADYDGYHKAQAGVEATLPRLLRLPTGDRKLNEELLNPAGINVIKKSRGNFILWGDRTTHLDPTWKFAHQREQMSYYEHVLLENFDWIIFTINDAISDKQAETALIQFFMPEWSKRALRGASFQEACVIKVDDELNTNAVRANGDKIASISLRLADTTERFIIRVGKMGVFESVG